MRETERQINIYKEKLPRMKERVGAALVMLLLAVVMTVSSSMAWLVLSSDPEVKGMNTTITANGNLEIALASGTTITPPSETAIGDGSLPLVERNITWGNLVNLGDPAYGLENIVLRPAMLNRNTLLDSPLYAAGYGSDGRVDVLESDFAYAYYDSKNGVFSAEDTPYGVRTVASVTYTDIGGNVELISRSAAAEQAIGLAKSHIQNNVAAASEISQLGSVMGAFVQSKLDNNTAILTEEQVEDIYNLMTYVRDNIELCADALAKVYNIRMLRFGGSDYVKANEFTGEYLLNATDSELNTKLAKKNAQGEVIVAPAFKAKMAQLRVDYKTMNSDIATMQTYLGRSDVTIQDLDGQGRPEIRSFVDHIAQVTTTQIDGTPIGQLSASNISSFMGSSASKPKDVVVTQGILQRLDMLTGAGVKTGVLKITAKYIITVTVYGAVRTNASTYAEFDVVSQELKASLEGESGYKGTNPVAGDTFGMALDFFLRTNSPNAHLILQGAPVYERKTLTVKANVDGIEYDVYTVKVDGSSATAYLKGDTYYNYNVEYKIAGGVIGTTSEITEATLLTEEVKNVVGYSGVNRVWDEDSEASLDITSTTQGAGSCYTFYASSPEDQEKSIQLLDHFRIAFVSEGGQFLGGAHLDTANKFEQSGKVTVPLALDTDNTFVTSESGDQIYTITELIRNKATFITAVVYLDGRELTNDQVLAAGEIQGQLNIQFGTTTDLEAMNDPVLKEQKCSVSAVMEGETTVPFDTPDQLKLTKTITVTVDGYTPSKVEAYFLREINETQGVRQGKITFEPNGEGGFKGSHIFTAPGKYILREVILDGVTYELNHEPIVFTVEGFTISSVSCVDSGKSFMLTDKSFDTSVSLTFASSDQKKMPSDVKGAFIHQDTGNRTTVYFTPVSGGTWSGSATFTTSGEYKMEYLELDGQYTGLEPSQHISIDLQLGLTARVSTTDKSFDFGGETIIAPMTLVIKSDAGEDIRGLDNVWLYYSLNNSLIEEKGSMSQMVWDDSKDNYIGEFKLDKPGIYKFWYVSIGEDNEKSYLTTAAAAPTLTLIPPDPPQYVEKAGFEEVFSLNNDAAFTVTMKYANAATVDAALVNEKGETYYVRAVKTGDDGETQVFTFTVPVIEGKQSGIWSLDGLYMTNVYDANLKLWDGATDNGPDEDTDSKPLYTVAEGYYDAPADNSTNGWWYWPLSELGGGEATVAVVSDININLLTTSSASRYFGKTDVTNKDSATNGLFGTEYDLSQVGLNSLQVNITAGNNKLLSDYGLVVTGITLDYSYNAGSVVNNKNTYGEYTVPDGWANLTPTTISYNQFTSIGSTYTVTTSNTKVSVAGLYKATNFKVTVARVADVSESVILTPSYATAPEFAVYSVAPSVKISTTSQKNGSVTTDTGNNGSGHTTQTASYSDTSATVYTKCATNRILIWTVHNYTSPTVTISLSNIGTANSASLTFSTGGDSKAVKYEWTANGDQTKTIGTVESKSAASDIKKPAGEIKATQLMVIKKINNINYTFIFDTNITINHKY